MNSIWRNAAIDSAQSFLSRNNIYNINIEKNIFGLKENKPISIWVHQPNILTSLTVLSSAIELFQYSKNFNTIPVFVILDYDEAGDQRFRSPSLPSINDLNNKYFLTGAVNKKNRKKIANTIVLKKELIDEWEIKYKDNLRRWSKYLNINTHDSLNKKSNFDFFHGRKVTEASTLQILEDLKRIGIDGIVPVFASNIWRTLYKESISYSLEFIKNKKIKFDELLWWICPNCNERKSSLLSLNGLVDSECRKCDKKLQEHFTKIKYDEIFPKHTLCNIIDIIFSDANNFIFYYKTQNHFESTCNIVNCNGIQKPRLYTHVNSFKIPNNNSSIQLSKYWEDGAFSLKFLIDLFDYDLDILKNNINHSIHTYKVEY